jgi:hypothetical protein
MTRSMLAMAVAACMVCAPHVTHAQATPPAPAIAPAFEQDIRRLLDMTGAQKLGEQMANTFMQQFSQSIKASNPNIPPRAMEIAIEVARKMFTDRYPALMPKMVAAYAKVLTPDDVRQMLAFYETPLGKRMIEVTPALSQAGAQAGQEWGQSMVPDLQTEIQKRFKAEGLIP